jgi:hypothetical protein
MFRNFDVAAAGRYETEQVMHRFDLAAPFAAAILIYLIFPLLSRQVQSVVNGAISEGRVHAGPIMEDNIPYYLAPPSIEDYVEYAMDAVQVFPTFLLPIVGSIYTFSNGVPREISVTILILVVVVMIAMSAWIMSQSPSNYVSRKWLGYSIITLFGVIVNIASMTLTLLFAS